MEARGARDASAHGGLADGGDEGRVWAVAVGLELVVAHFFGFLFFLFWFFPDAGREAEGVE